MIYLIDLSHHNQLEDSAFHRFVECGISAVIHKATEGVNSVDPTFASRRERASSVGLYFGAYHFATGEDPIAQANHFIDTTQGVLCRALDWETPEMTYAGVLAFINRVKAVSGRMPLLYAPAYFLASQLKAEGITTPDTTTLSQCPLWIAEYGTAPLVPKAWASYTIWQFSQTETVPGMVIPGYCDKDQFNGDASALKALFQ